MEVDRGFGIIKEPQRAPTPALVDLHINNAAASENEFSSSSSSFQFQLETDRARHVTER